MISDGSDKRSFYFMCPQYSQNTHNTHVFKIEVALYYREILQYLRLGLEDSNTYLTMHYHVVISLSVFLIRAVVESYSFMFFSFLSNYHPLIVFYFILSRIVIGTGE